MDGQRSCADDGGKRPARRAAGKGAPPDARRAESGRHAEATGPGRLYLVATPIGNLEDITFRAVRMLQEADVIAAEDTRQTRKLLNRYGIGGTLVSYHEHNKRTSGPALVNRMLAGQSVALVSDAGMPGILRPGGRPGAAGGGSGDRRGAGARPECGLECPGGLRPEGRAVSVRRFSDPAAGGSWPRR